MLDKLLSQTGKWLEAEGPESDIVISSRIRLARNLRKHIFSNRASNEELVDIRAEIFNATSKNEYLKNSSLLEIDTLDINDKLFLMERHLISRELIAARSGGLVLDPGEMISIMLNEEDHIRFQIIESGLKLLDAWTIADKIDSLLEKEMEFAYSVDFGYITACPTNVGTGLRASTLVHLPALTLSEQIKGVLKAVSQIHMAVRGFYGEGTEATGNFYQISNQVTLGHSEEEIINNIEMVTRQIIEHERNAREMLMETNPAGLEDKIYRALGTLSNARILSIDEVMDLLSTLRLGVDLKLIENISHKTLNCLLIMIQPSHLKKISGKDLTGREADIVRADIVREELNFPKK